MIAGEMKKLRIMAHIFNLTGMKRIVSALLLFFLIPVFPGFGNPSGDPVLLRVGERQITRSEFEAAYLKNNVEMQVAEPKTVEEYLELYIDFNLKVLEAMSKGIDTLSSFQEELQTYRRQLARPYFRDDSLTEDLVREAYERMMYDIRASHILINVEEHAMPSDTMEAYQRIMEIRERHLNGESFASLAAAYSDDASARDMAASGNAPARRGNQGDLGYFTVFNMVYPFESAAYSTPVGEVSMPARTRFGYHLIKVTDRLPAVGTARVAHIMIMTPQGAGQEVLEVAEGKIRDVHAKLLDGRDFADLAMAHSEDQNSAPRGGEMPPFQSNRMVPEFIAAIGKLENPGDVSPPVRTAYGWHIIKLLERVTPGSFEEMQPDLANRVSRDTRGQLSHEAVIRNLKKIHGFGEDLAALQIFFSIVDDGFFQGDNPASGDSGLEEKLFWFGPHVYYQKDFARFLRDNHAPQMRSNHRAIVNDNYTRFVNESLVAYEDSFLEEKYPEFKAIMREYHDGILLFEITDQEVWSRAVQDTSGMRAFFDANRDRYLWEARMHATLFSTSDDATAQEVLELLSRNMDDPAEAVLQQMNTAEPGRVSVREARFQRGDHPAADLADWQPGVYGPFQQNGQTMVVKVHGILPPARKEKSEVRGLLIADYQNHLEKIWVAELREKYEIVVHREVLDQVKRNY